MMLPFCHFKHDPCWVPIDCTKFNILIKASFSFTRNSIDWNSMRKFWFLLEYAYYCTFLQWIVLINLVLDNFWIPINPFLWVLISSITITIPEVITRCLWSCSKFQFRRLLELAEVTWEQAIIFVLFHCTRLVIIPFGYIDDRFRNRLLLLLERIHLFCNGRKHLGTLLWMPPFEGLSSMLQTRVPRYGGTGCK